MKIAYLDHKFVSSSYHLIDNANRVIEEYKADNYTLTLRQLYYRFVHEKVIENNDKMYKKLTGIMTKAREAGLVPWDAIEDRSRTMHKSTPQESIPDLLSSLKYHIYYDLWARQDTYVEVWVEKEALSNVVERACNAYRVPWMACKGYLSASHAWRGGRRFRQAKTLGKKCVLIHLGDHDPSGMDMTDDNHKRLKLFSESNEVEIRRVALNMSQIRQYNPPPDPVKVKADGTYADTRAIKYVAKFGEVSWELDALRPQVMVDIIKKEIKNHIDQKAWDATKHKEKEKEDLLELLADNWPSVEAYLAHIDDD